MFVETVTQKMDTRLITNGDTFAPPMKERAPKKQKEPSRVQDQRVDIKVSPQVYKELKTVKTQLEKTSNRVYSMSDVISMMYDWSLPKLDELHEAHAKTVELTTKKSGPRVFH